MERNKERKLWIDALKGLGIILVVASHISTLHQYTNLITLLGRGYMAMFFIASGYTSKNEEFTLGISKKFKRLLTPYFFYGIAITLFFTLLDIISKKNIQYNEWAGLLYSRYCLLPLGEENNIHLLSGRSTAPLWFLTAMFISYIWFYIYINLKKFKNKTYCIITYISATILLSFPNILLPWSIDTSFLFALFLITGYELKTAVMKDYNKNITYFSTITFLTIIYLLLFNINGNSNLSVRIYGSQGVISILIYYSFSLIITLLYGEVLKGCKNNFITKALAFVGKHSLRIMCIHIPLITLIPINCDLFIYVFLKFLAVLLVSIFLSWILEFIFSKYSEKYNTLKYL